jgi:short-subunit dehydrogenase
MSKTIAIFGAGTGLGIHRPALRPRGRQSALDLAESRWPVSTNSFVPATELTADVMQSFLNLHLLTPIEIVRQVLPSMIEKRHGAILMTLGSSAVHPSSFMTGVGPAMAAVRNYVRSLHGEVADKGIYVGTLLVGALILGSAWHRQLSSGESGVPAGVASVDPDLLASVLWDMFSRRDRIEAMLPVPG